MYSGAVALTNSLLEPSNIKRLEHLQDFPEEMSRVGQIYVEKKRAGATSAELMAFIEEQQSKLTSMKSNVKVPVVSGNTRVPVQCSELSPAKLVSLLWSLGFSKRLDLSYGSPVHCHVLNKLRERSPLGFIKWEKLVTALPEEDYTASIKTLDLTNQKLTNGSFLEFFDALTEKYPDFKPTTIIIDGNLETPEMIPQLQRNLQRFVPGVTLVLNKKGGSKKMTRYRRGTKQSKWRKSNRNRRFH